METIAKLALWALKERGEIRNYREHPLNEEEQKKVADFAMNNLDRLAKMALVELGRTSTVCFFDDCLDDGDPITIRPENMPFTLPDEMRKYIEEKKIKKVVLRACRVHAKTFLGLRDLEKEGSEHG